jgi:hypothetical protein
MHTTVYIARFEATERTWRGTHRGRGAPKKGGKTAKKEDGDAPRVTLAEKETRVIFKDKAWARLYK